ncbi:hypothetical protein MTY59_41130 [Mycobacterium senriense]|uniref:Uncharacterized protein n=1 Tax=Mycobacterium senriense TaxID=2775496 RepID=A0ABM7SSD5_9MYCO|nr:hypothetical protein MTY59_41130 [Mycobacterium senriense]
MSDSPFSVRGGPEPVTSVAVTSRCETGSRVAARPEVVRTTQRRWDDLPPSDKCAPCRRLWPANEKMAFAAFPGLGSVGRGERGLALCLLFIALMAYLKCGR